MTRNIYEVLVEAGAPRLPKGYKYRVYEPETLPGGVGVDLHYRAHWFSIPKLVDYGFIRESHNEGLSTVVYLCKQVASAAVDRAQNPAKEFFGRHP